jgi:S-adenosylmethionine hydrolase
VQATFFLISSWEYLPEGSITIVIVDPGVGTERDILILKKDKKIVIAPDNGILGGLLAKFPSKNTIFSLDKSKISKYLLHSKLSSTFHGRDIFAPLSIYIAQGKDISLVASEIDEQTIKKIFIPHSKVTEKTIETCIIHIDRFGNCILSLEDHLKHLLSKYEIYLQPISKKVFFVESYAQIPEGEIGLLDGSQGYLELALNQDSLARKYNINIGDAIVFEIKH